jgi:myosin-1
VGRLNFLSQNPNFENRQGQFIVKHYAGDVSYAVQGMTDKNKDQLLKDLLNLVQSSGNHFVHTIFPEQVNQDDKRRPPTASDKIKASANDLVATLMKAQPSYIRTIKPNDNKAPKEYNEGNVLHQIKYLGLQENVRIRRAGFAYRQTFDKFVERFYLLSPKTSYAGDYTWTGDVETGARQILKDTRIPAEEYQMGITKVFIKTPETLFALEAMRDRYWHNMAIRIQRAWRNYLRYRTECAIRIQRFWRRTTGGLEFIKLRDQGHQILAGRKERRRMSILGSRRFLGDYVGIGNKGGPGEMIRSGAAISSMYIHCPSPVDDANNLKAPKTFSSRAVARFSFPSLVAPASLHHVFLSWSVTSILCVCHLLTCLDKPTCVHRCAKHRQQPARHRVGKDYSYRCDQDRQRFQLPRRLVLACRGWTGA